MIGTRFYKPIQPDQIEKEIERTDADGNPYIETVMVDNDAPNTDAKYAEAAHWCNETQKATIEDMGDWYEVVALPEPSEEEIRESLFRQYQDIIQDKLDSEAQKLGYDNADRVIARQNSTNPKYRAEGVAFNQWYDDLWGFGLDMLNKVEAGEIEIPTPEDFEAMLPELSIEYPEAD